MVDVTTARAVAVSDVVQIARDLDAAVRRQAAGIVFKFDDGTTVTAEEVLFGGE